MARKRKRSSQKARNEGAAVSSKDQVQRSSSEITGEADVSIDGSCGEGGGQIVRTALALSSVLGASVRVDRIRHGRSNPGLQAQHLTGAQLVARICGVTLQGANQGSSSILLERVTDDVIDHTLPLESAVATAGATSLVLQAALPAALRYLPSFPVGADQGPVSLKISGGTTALFAPTSDYVSNVLVPNLRHFGLNMDYSVVRHGFFPRGGGCSNVIIDKAGCETQSNASPAEKTVLLRACDLRNRGNVTSIKGRILVCGAKYIHAQIGEAMARKTIQTLRKFTRATDGYPEISADDLTITNLTEAEGRGECVAVTIYARTSLGTVLGSSSIWSERDARKIALNINLEVPRKDAHFAAKAQFWQQTAGHAGSEAAEELCNALRTGACVDSHMADQLCIFMAMAKGISRLLVPEPTKHLMSVVDVFRSFDVDIHLDDVPSSSNRLVVCCGKAVPLR